MFYNERQQPNKCLTYFTTLTCDIFWTRRFGDLKPSPIFLSSNVFLCFSFGVANKFQPLKQKHSSFWQRRCFQIWFPYTRILARNFVNLKIQAIKNIDFSLKAQIFLLNRHRNSHIQNFQEHWSSVGYKKFDTKLWCKILNVTTKVIAWFSNVFFIE